MNTFYMLFTKNWKEMTNRENENLCVCIKEKQ